jgi:hypothetical protein
LTSELFKRLNFDCCGHADDILLKYRRIQLAVESSDVVQILAHNLQLPNVNKYAIQKFLLAQREEQEQKQVKSEDKPFKIITRLP